MDGYGHGEGSLAVAAGHDVEAEEEDESSHSEEDGALGPAHLAPVGDEAEEVESDTGYNRECFEVVHGRCS